MVHRSSASLNDPQLPEFQITGACWKTERMDSKCILDILFVQMPALVFFFHSGWFGIKVKQVAIYFSVTHSWPILGFSEGKVKCLWSFMGTWRRREECKFLTLMVMLVLDISIALSQKEKEMEFKNVLQSVLADVIVSRSPRAWCVYSGVMWTAVYTLCRGIFALGFAARANFLHGCLLAGSSCN